MDEPSAISQVVLMERQGRDRGWWEQMAARYAPDSQVAISWFRGTGAEFTELSRQQSTRGVAPVHRLSPPAVHVDDDRAFLDVPVSIEARVVLAGVEVDLTSSARLLYRLERHESGWLITHVTAIYERDRVQPVVPGAEVKLDEQRLAQFREPYRYLAYQLTESGVPIKDDLYGLDQPERVTALYEETFDWLRTAPQ